MPTTPVPQDVQDLLAQPNPAVMATVGKDGRPVTVATWYLLEDDGTILLGLDAGRARLAHLRNDPRVALTALVKGDWYSHVSIQGHVTSIVEDDGLQGIDRISRHYTGDDYANRVNARVLATVEIDRWHGWAHGSPMDE